MGLRYSDSSPRQQAERSGEKKDESFRLGDFVTSRKTHAAPGRLAEVRAPRIVVGLSAVIFATAHRLIGCERGTVQSIRHRGGGCDRNGNGNGRSRNSSCDPDADEYAGADDRAEPIIVAPNTPNSRLRLIAAK
jgi:hypothetical protein